jgi:hypothetical protein
VKSSSISPKNFLLLSCDQPQHGRRYPLIAACVPGGNIGFQLETENGMTYHSEASRKRAGTHLSQKDFELNN